MQATPFSEKSFILATDFGERLGIIIKDPQEENLTLVTKDSQDDFGSVKELEEILSDEIHFIEPENTTTDEDLWLEGFPIKHKKTYNVEHETLEDAEIIKYTSTPNSKVQWVAGWWAVKINDTYVGFFCPKLATVTENNHVGPFKDKAETAAAIIVYNKKED